MLDPMSQFEQWLTEETACGGKADPTAMTLATLGDDGYPSARVVLFKGCLEELGRKGITFYTNYHSAKGEALERHSKAAVTWYWPETYRQVRMVGDVTRLDAAASDAYFESRPRLSNANAIVSPQSQVIDSLDSLEEAAHTLLNEDRPLSRPSYWGGYLLLPKEIEYWQGGENRLHDRVVYVYQAGEWQVRRLAP